MFLALRFERLGFSFADVKRRSRMIEFLRHYFDDLRSRRVGKLAQFIERFLQVPFRHAVALKTYQDRAFSLLVADLEHQSPEADCSRLCTMRLTGFCVDCDRFNAGKLGSR